MSDQQPSRTPHCAACGNKFPGHIPDYCPRCRCDLIIVPPRNVGPKLDPVSVTEFEWKPYSL